MMGVESGDQWPWRTGLVASVPKKLMGVFTGVTAQSQAAEPIASEGVIEVGMGLRRIELAIPKQTQGTYPAIATVGIEMVFLAHDGRHSSIRNSKDRAWYGDGRGTSCQVEGLEAIVQEAIDSATTDWLNRSRNRHRSGNMPLNETHGFRWRHVHALLWRRRQRDPLHRFPRWSRRWRTRRNPRRLRPLTRCS